MDLLREIELLARRPDIRSAERANMRRLIAKAHAGQRLAPNEREQLWAYVKRYSAGPAGR